MITIQELHKYFKLIEAGIENPIPCPSDPEHTDMIPFVNDDLEPILMCLGCKSKIHIGENLSNSIKRYL
jgi:hypothetical protein